MIRIAVFASGSGSNAENIVRHFEGNKLISTPIILTNNKDAGVIQRAKRLKIPCSVFSNIEFRETDKVLKLLESAKIDYIVLAGFLLLVPKKIIYKYKDRIINIHPALLPHFGGKGFYGMKVHKAVIDTGAIMSGITIHHVNEQFDDGEIIFQAACHVSKEDTAESLAGKIHALEYAYFPVVIEKLIRKDYNL
jgi:phosphoribosylglycinamide formyltransferase-1